MWRYTRSHYLPNTHPLIGPSINQHAHSCTHHTHTHTHTHTHLEKSYHPLAYELAHINHLYCADHIVFTMRVHYSSHCESNTKFPCTSHHAHPSPYSPEVTAIPSMAIRCASNGPPIPAPPSTYPDIEVVHVINSCHLDIGFADSSVGIINRYVQVTLPVRM